MSRAETKSSSMAITSSAFANETSIPARYTCEGTDVSPPLSWSGLPDGTKSMVLIVDDPDAPDPRAPRMTWVHWVLYNLPPTAFGLEEGSRLLPPGTKEGVNGWNRPGYGGPCPPIGRHRYFHKLYALDTVLPDLGRADKRAVVKAMEGHILGRVAMVGTYEMRRK